MIQESTALESVLKRDRMVVLLALAAVTALAWLYLILMAVAMADMPAAMGEAVAMTQIKPWSAADFALMFLMWAIMMVGMMLPSAAPMILVFAAFNRKQHAEGRLFVPTGAFVAGYLLVWTAFGAVATTLQWALDQAALLSPMMVSTSPLLGGLLLIAAGVFQLTPLKNMCLTHCRSPLQFVMTSWRKGARGAVAMGLHHGAFCLGCCWFLMMLLFFGGVMNLMWIALITIFVLMEKALPYGSLLGRMTAPVMIAVGTLVAVNG